MDDKQQQEATPLPDDLAACHALLEEMSSRLRHNDTLVVEQAQTLVEFQASREKLFKEIEELELTVAKLLARLYGNRSERFVEDPNQLQLDFGGDPATQDALADAAAEAREIIEEYTVRRRRKAPKRHNEKLPAHIPRYEVMAEVPDELKHCPAHGQRTIIDYDETETLEFERPKLRVRVTKYPKYACKNRPACGIASPERPTSLVEGNRYDTSVAAEVIVGKHGYHMPLYREQDWFAGSGWTPSRSTLLNILVAGEFVLRPLAEHYQQVVVESGGLGCDETTVTLIVPPTIPAIDPRDPRSQRVHEVISKAHAEQRRSIKAKMWAYRSFDVPVNVFDFTVSRHRDGPDEFLEGYRGTLMADCWSGFLKINLRSDLRIVRAACWTHARRKVLEGRTSHSNQACVLLALLRRLYDVEERAKTFTVENRESLRERVARPLLDKVRAYIDSEELRKVLPKSAFGKALGYLRNHWDALNVYLSDGRTPIDNNDVEQLMKQVALGRKNWLFLGSIEAGKRAATLMTIISTALRNDLDVWCYVKDVLDQLLAGSTDYASLRADVWKQTHPEAIRQYRADERRDAADRRSVRRARRRVVRRLDNRR